MCWLSGDDFPEVILKCIDSWRIHLSDYEIWLWGRCPKGFNSKDVSAFKIIKEVSFDVNSIPWTKQAYNTGKYAFAADYIRLYALYNYGGIYLDSDVLMYKSFNSLLNYPYFIGLDHLEGFEPAIIGAEQGTRWLGEILERYKDLPFVNRDGSYNTQTLPCVFYDMLNGKYKFKKASDKVSYSNDPNIIYIFNRYCFNSRDAFGAIKTSQSYCSHNYAASWLDDGKKEKGGTVLPRRLYNFIWRLYHLFLFRNKYSINLKNND